MDFNVVHSETVIELLVRLGPMQDIQRVAVVPQVGIRGQRSIKLTQFLEPACAVNHGGVLEGKNL